MTIGLITTGGTIDRICCGAKGGYEVGPPQIMGILREAHVHFEFDVISVLTGDSPDMTDEDRLLIRSRIEEFPHARIVLTHGTDTLIQTARMLDGIVGKTIILTAVVQPEGYAPSKASFNIGLAIGAVQILPTGIYIAMNGRIFNPAITLATASEGRFEEF